jgi:pilus assembly protein CpaB
MSSALRLSLIVVLLLATAALGLMTYNAYLPKPVAQVAPNLPAAPAIGYLVAAHPLPAGTLARDEDFAVRSGGAPSGAIADTPDARAGLRGSLVRRFLDVGAPVTSDDILRPRDRGFLASVLAPDTRAVSIKVDAESGVAGLIWPGDYVDVVLTQTSDKLDAAHRALSEVVLHNVRIIAIDQDFVQGAKDTKDNNAAASKDTHSVSLQLAPEQVQKIAVAKDLGKLSLAIRSAVEQRNTEDAGTTFGCDVSPEMARQSAVASQSATVVVYAGDKTREFSVQKHDAGKASAAFGCDLSENVASQGPALAKR